MCLIAKDRVLQKVAIEDSLSAQSGAWKAEAKLWWVDFVQSFSVWLVAGQLVPVSSHCHPCVCVPFLEGHQSDWRLS